MASALKDYASAEIKKEPHHGETPIGVIDDAVASSQKALDAALTAAPYVTKNKAEFDRVVNDMHAISLLMRFYNAKTKAAEQILLYGYDHDAAHLHDADALLAESVERFRDLTNLAGPAYRTATQASETTQRQIPFRGGIEPVPKLATVFADV